MKVSVGLPCSRRVSSLAFLALLLALPVLTSSLAHAFSGGNGNPLSNGTFFPNEGTFQTTVRGINLSGVATFSTGGNGTSSAATSTGSFTISYQGLSYSGNVDASMDSARGTIAALLEASIGRSGNGTLTEIWLGNTLKDTGKFATNSGGTTNVAVTNITGGHTDTLGGVVNVYGAQTNVTSTTNALPGTSTPIQTYTDLHQTTDYIDTLYASGSFTAKLKNSYPNQIFSGKGTVDFMSIDFSLSPPSMVSSTVDISVKGVRISNVAQSFTARPVEVPSVLTTTQEVDHSSTN